MCLGTVYYRCLAIVASLLPSQRNQGILPLRLWSVSSAKADGPPGMRAGYWMVQKNQILFAGIDLQLPVVIVNTYFLSFEGASREYYCFDLIINIWYCHIWQIHRKGMEYCKTYKRNEYVLVMGEEVW